MICRNLRSAMRASPLVVWLAGLPNNWGTRLCGCEMCSWGIVRSFGQILLDCTFCFEKEFCKARCKLSCMLRRHTQELIVSRALLMEVAPQARSNCNSLQRSNVVSLKLDKRPNIAQPYSYAAVIALGSVWECLVCCLCKYALSQNAPCTVSCA